MININVDVSEDGLVNSILNVSNGEPDTKSIIVIAIIVVSIAISIFKHMMATRERRQNEKVADKSIVGWIQAAKKEKTYIDMLLWQYIQWAFCFVVCLFIHAYLAINLRLDIWIVHIISRLAYILYVFLYGRYLWKNQKIKESMKYEKKHKVRASVSIFLIFFITFNLITIDSLVAFAEILFGITIFIWAFYIFNNWEMRYVYENKYATIYTKESRKIKNVQAWEIKSLKGWIELSVSKNGEMQKQRIRKEDIKDATYYGGQVTVITYNKFWLIRDRIVE